jgi:hypothetical protein
LVEDKHGESGAALVDLIVGEMEFNTSKIGKVEDPRDKILTSGSTTRQRTDTPKCTDKRRGLIQDLHAKLREATSHTSKLPTSVFKTLTSRLSA